MGIIFKAPAVFIYVIAGLWGLYISFGIIQAAAGTIVAFLGLFLAPVLLGLAPWYAGFVQGDWFPLLLVYGGGIGASILFAIGSSIDGGQ